MARQPSRPRKTTAQIVTKGEALRIPLPASARFSVVARHNAMSAEIFAPRGRDRQKPHRQDEIYVVIRGRAQLRVGRRTRPVGTGDFLFVRAGVRHRFEAMSEDFATWAIFYGPDGGEPA